MQKYWRWRIQLCKIFDVECVGSKRKSGNLSYILIVMPPVSPAFLTFLQFCLQFSPALITPPPPPPLDERAQ